MPATLLTCPACAGFVPAARPTCPHCDAALAPRSARARLARRLAALVGGAAVSMTLMACYGAMMHPHEYAQPCPDADGDGACEAQDCDDAERAVYPGAEDPDLDGIDQNCDGVDGWRDPGAVAAPDPAAPPPEPAPVATDPAPEPAPSPGSP